MIPIVDWNAIKAEYIGGNISQRKLAEKYGVPYNTLKEHSIKGGWVEGRNKTHSKVIAKAQQRTADAAANNATLAADIKKRLLLRLQRIEEKYPLDATEVRAKSGDKMVIFRLRDLTAAYKDLTEDIAGSPQDKNAPIYELLKRLDDECGV